MRFPWRRSVLTMVGMPLGLLAAGALVWPQAHASFTSSTATATSWTAGTVQFGPNQPVSKIVDVSGLLPGSTDDACVKLTYTGTLAAPVKLYLRDADLGGTGLATYLTVQINEGTGNSSDCADFVLGTTVYNAAGMPDTARTLAAFNTATENYGSGVGAWTASPASTTRTYQVSWQVQASGAAAGKTASATFTWEARNA